MDVSGVESQAFSVKSACYLVICYLGSWLLDLAIEDRVIPDWVIGLLLIGLLLIGLLLIGLLGVAKFARICNAAPGRNLQDRAFGGLAAQ